VGALWVGLAIIVGVSLRFMSLPPYMIPVLVGVAVASVTVVLLRVFLLFPEPDAADLADEREEAPAPLPAVAAHRNRRSGPVKRLNGGARRAPPPTREASEN
jgi:hypothetical protein